MSEPLDPTPKVAAPAAAAPPVAPAAAVPPPPPGARPAAAVVTPAATPASPPPPPDTTPTVFTVSAAQKIQLEKLLAGAIPDAAHLIERVANLSSVSIGGIRLDFTAKQMQEIERRAKRNNEAPEVLLRRMLKLLEPMFFTGT